jgi:biopolymer transport protein ExbB
MIDYFVKGGWLMYPILLCSIIGVSILINKGIQYRQLLKELEAPVENLFKARPAVLRPLLEGVERSCSEDELAIIGTGQVREIEKGLSWLGLVTTIAPLLGFTGTVTGMISAFMVIADSDVVRPAMVAGGIWEALITTAGGLFVAIPIHIGHHYLEKQADQITFLMREITVILLKRKPASGI